MVVVDAGAACVLVGGDKYSIIMSSVLTDPEKYIKTANVRKQMPSIQGIQKRGHDELIGKYGVPCCCSCSRPISQRQECSIFGNCKNRHHLQGFNEPKHPEMLELFKVTQLIKEK